MSKAEHVNSWRKRTGDVRVEKVADEVDYFLIVVLWNFAQKFVLVCKHYICQLFMQCQTLNSSVALSR